MPKKTKIETLDLETLTPEITKSAEMGMLQWEIKLINEGKRNTPEYITRESEIIKAQEDMMYEQYLSFGSALRLNNDNDYTPDDVERVMRHFISAVDREFYAQGIKGLDRGNYQIDDEVAHYIKESFLTYIDSTKKKGELDRAFKTVKKGGVKKPFASPHSGFVPEVIQNIMDEFMDKEEQRIGKPPLNLTGMIEGYSKDKEIKLQTLKDWWKQYHGNALVMFEMYLGLNNKVFTDPQVKQIQDNFIPDFRK